jgi:hypothetical protein
MSRPNRHTPIRGFTMASVSSEAHYRNNRKHTIAYRYSHAFYELGEDFENFLHPESLGESVFKAGYETDIPDQHIFEPKEKLLNDFRYILNHTDSFECLEGEIRYEENSQKFKIKAVLERKRKDDKTKNKTLYETWKVELCPL